jgi:hypothetical protein
VKRSPGRPRTPELADVVRGLALRVLDEQAGEEIGGTGLGLTLLTRKCLESMTAHYRATLSAHASVHDAAPTVMLTRLMVAEDPYGRAVELSEDLSLCERWRQMGGRVMLYVGAGSPATHHGDMALRGAIESLGLTRGPRSPSDVPKRVLGHPGETAAHPGSDGLPT